MTDNSSLIKKSVTTISTVQIEHNKETLGIGSDCPRLSWIIETTINEWHQSGYEIESYDSDGKLHGRTRRIESDQSVLVPWPFAPLSSRERLTLRVRVWGMDGQPSTWSESTPLEVGLLHAQDWTAHFITPDWKEEITRPQPAPLLRREFNVSAAEMDLQDQWQEAVIGCAIIGNDSAHLQQSMQSVAKWVHANWEDGQVIDEKIEIL